MFYLKILLAACIFGIGLKYKRYAVVFLIFIQTIVAVYFEIFILPGTEITNNLFVDKLSIIMTLIAGIIGSLICVYALGYMQSFHRKLHPEIKDRRSFFFFIFFIFLSSMFGIIFSNNLLWLYFFWELTTICSFILIGYKETEEARNNAFRALELNLLGGLAFIVAIIYTHNSLKTVELDKLIILGKASAMIPVVLLCLSGLIKSAQFPFSSWLVGAMVAPVPVSALLHASTMVKAGVYIMLRLSLAMGYTLAGYLLALIGGITFLVSSFIAISQNEAKKVLAYSTVANLGLIVLCAGVGTYEAAWAAILLIIFHAITKGLLFLCTGIAEEKLGSMDIEEMSGMIITLPKTAIMMQIGMAGMFLAPFGMLISKWAVLNALVDYNPLLAIFVVFGSCVTLFFWVKWIGKLITVSDSLEAKEGGISLDEWISLFSLSFLTIGICFFFPWIAKVLIEPYLIEAYDKTVHIHHDNVVMMMLMFGMVMLFPLSFIHHGRRLKVAGPYLAGANLDNQKEKFRGPTGKIRDMQIGNYYLKKYLPEEKLLRAGDTCCLFLLLGMLGLL
jgi:ech hydrogenase subunit A